VNYLQQQGTPIPTNDIWIAASTLECSGRLVSKDDHFRFLPVIDLEKE
jgi:tRNA(fMet)-specific endonuclease VapC